MNVDEAIAVFDKSADRTKPNAQTEAWAVLRAELLRLHCKCGVFGASDPHTSWCPASTAPDGNSWYEYWISNGRADIANDFGAFQLAEKWAALSQPPAVDEAMVERFANSYYARGVTYSPDRIRAALTAALHQGEQHEQ